MRYNYSIIIPHKNIPNLLKRCLDSIPQRKDIQIIIVDDDSSPELVAFDNFPGVNRADTEVYFTKEGKGAGFARNIGLEHSEGKYIIFADSDDFFTSSFNEILDAHLLTDYDLSYFSLTSVISETLEPANRGIRVNYYINKALAGDEEAKDIIKYKFLYPTSKIIKHSIIKDNNIRFDEVPASNDTMFGVKVAIAARSISFSDKTLYCLTLRQNSLVTSYTYTNLESRVKVSVNLFRVLKKIGKEQYSQNTFDHWLQIRHCSYWKLLKATPLLFQLPLHELIKQIVFRRRYVI